MRVLLLTAVSFARDNKYDTDGVWIRSGNSFSFTF